MTAPQLDPKFVQETWRSMMNFTRTWDELPEASKDFWVRFAERLNKQLREQREAGK